jgi:hypothetical protein
MSENISFTAEINHSSPFLMKTANFLFFYIAENEYLLISFLTHYLFVRKTSKGYKQGKKYAVIISIFSLMTYLVSFIIA